MSLKVSASEPFKWVADRLPEDKYAEMLGRIQVAVGDIAQDYGFDFEVCDSFGEFCPLRFERE